MADGSVPAHTFLVEHYWASVTPEEFAITSERVRLSAEQLQADGLSVHYLHATLVPEDAAAFCVLAADSRELVEEVYARARVAFERIVDAVEQHVTRGGDE